MNILTTIPKSKWKDRKELDYILSTCNGEEEGDIWLVNVANLPTKAKAGDFCYMVYSGEIIGYFDIVGSDTTENLRKIYRIGKRRNTFSLILANWHPIKPQPYTGFQGIRYTELSPLL